MLPKGTGKTVRVAVFADGDNAEAAKAAGADLVGLDDLAETVKKGEIDFDICIATPDSMRVVGQLGQILGPRGIMPNPKVGTVWDPSASNVEWRTRLRWWLVDVAAVVDATTKDVTDVAVVDVETPWSLCVSSSMIPEYVGFPTSSLRRSRSQPSLLVSVVAASVPAL